MSETSELGEACAEAARRGGAILRRKWGEVRTIELKGGIDLVTDADRASEAALLEFLRARFPGAAVLAEESGAVVLAGGHDEAVPPGPPLASGQPDPAAPALATSRLRFYVDPLDGTTNYAHGVPHFAVNVAAADAAGLAAGATYDPLRDELFVAARGQGAFLGADRLRHSGRERLGGSLLATGFPYDVHERYEVPLALFAAFIRQARAVRRFGSAALDLAYVAAGRFDGFWELGLKPWDVAAGVVLAREAGAVVCDFEGGDRVLEGDIVAAAPALAAAMRAVIASVPR